MTERGGIDGYLLDDAYPSAFHREFSPAWMDAMLRHKGWTPPRTPRGPFRLLDLGCGDGFGLIALAAAYPEGEFIGIDAFAGHVADGAAAAQRIGLDNVSFRCARFADIADPTDTPFDYVTGQGLLAWISQANRDHVYRLARTHLRQGGVACLGYNAMPGWKDRIALQRLVRAFAEGLHGTAVQRFSAALDQIRSISAAGAAALPPALMDWLDELIALLPRSYFAHEYLNANWMPLWSADVASAMAERDLTYLAPSRLDRLRDDFCLTAAQRTALAAVADPVARETAADIFTFSSYRVDIFGHEVDRLGDAAEARLDGWWAAAAGADAEYFCRTGAGTLRFDSRAARAILQGLEHGSAPLRAIHAAGSAGTRADILNASDALFAAGHIIPADPPAEVPAAETANAEILARIRAGMKVDVAIGASGAMSVAHAIIVQAAGAGAEAAAARALLARLGVRAG